MNQKHLDQGLHNESVCKHLNKRPDYTDWVITTAFYSAMHLIYGYILPVNVHGGSGGGKARVKSFEELYHFMVPFKDQSKHEFSISYIEEHLPQLADYYQFLFDNCQMARYHEFKFDREISNQAVKCLKSIKDFCTQNSPPK